jgi:hypothetical protein
VRSELGRINYGPIVQRLEPLAHIQIRLGSNPGRPTQRF